VEEGRTSCKLPRIALSVATALTVLGLLYLATGQKEPRYQGKTAKQWFREWVTTRVPPKDYYAAMRELAPASVDYLALAAKGSPVQRAKRGLWEKLPPFLQRRFPQPFRPEVVQFYALRTLLELGQLAERAVPALVICLKDRDSSVRAMASQALGEFL